MGWLVPHPGSPRPPAAPAARCRPQLRLRPAQGEDSSRSGAAGEAAGLSWLLEDATARRTAHRVMAKKKRKGSDKKLRASRSAQGKQRQDRRDGWATRQRQSCQLYCIALGSGNHVGGRRLMCH
ncbi:hypothetical protein HaLaN_14202 [Haematococcus lacustris]|uniref:Uncharacterized protein n=1 Tax=Haematococcus lacustris TaxID=44745 RepID=A0A699ZNT7_HAELA|nr:hypothetical protein HaLaN_14202 [Haematococcus lacustris]